MNFIRDLRFACQAQTSLNSLARTAIRDSSKWLSSARAGHQRSIAQMPDYHTPKCIRDCSKAAGGSRCGCGGPLAGTVHRGRLPRDTMSHSVRHPPLRESLADNRDE
jgi:hypothetical protein